MTVLEEHVVRIVPRRSLIVSGLLSIGLAMIPTFGLAYWFTIPRGQGLWVAIVQGVVVLLSLAFMWRDLSVTTVVDDTELRGNGIFSPMVRVPLTLIASVDLVPTYLGQSHDPVTQLLVRDAHGKRLFRLRGNFWPTGALRTIAAALPVAPTIINEPLSLKEFFRAYPGASYWFEDRPALIALIFAGVVAICISIAVATMYLMQIPIMG
ncbi:MAG: hypothetical protein ABIR17_03085 [Pseudolysinimonas sp.]|uniref:hypothetical protein n=1 Tax=Pseudolysinimonas sp. TaxID=2680009 RepID=UPI0032657539